MLIPILSTIFAITLQKYLPQTSKQFLIQPQFNDFFLSAKGSVDVSIKLKDLIYLFIRNKNK